MVTVKQAFDKLYKHAHELMKYIDDSEKDNKTFSDILNEETRMYMQAVWMGNSTESALELAMVYADRAHGVHPSLAEFVQEHEKALATDSAIAQV